MVSAAAYFIGEDRDVTIPQDEIGIEFF